MRDDRDKREGQTGGLSKKHARQDRLKLALRENLKRRKSQARGRTDTASAASNPDDASPYDRGGKKPQP